MFLFNPPRRAKSKKRRAGRRSAGSAQRRRVRRALERAAVRRKTRSKKRRATPMARKTKKRSAAARKAARTRAAKKARRSAAARKGARSRRRRGGRVSRRRSVSRPSVRRRRRRSGSRGRVHRPAVYKRGGRFFQKRRGRLGLKGHRVNPGFSSLMPSVSGVTNILKNGGYGFVGWAGVNIVLMGANTVGLKKLTDGKSPAVAALVNTAVRALSVPLVVWLAGKVFKGGNARTYVAAGAAFNVVFHGVRDFVATSDAVPAWGQELLLGDGTGDFLTLAGVDDYMTAPGGTPSDVPALVASADAANESVFA